MKRMFLMLVIGLLLVGAQGNATPFSEDGNAALTTMLQSNGASEEKGVQGIIKEINGVWAIDVNRQAKINKLALDGIKQAKTVDEMIALAQTPVDSETRDQMLLTAVAKVNNVSSVIKLAGLTKSNIEGTKDKILLEGVKSAKTSKDVFDLAKETFFVDGSDDIIVKGSATAKTVSEIMPMALEIHNFKKRDVVLVQGAKLAKDGREIMWLVSALNDRSLCGSTVLENLSRVKHSSEIDLLIPWAFEDSTKDILREYKKTLQQKGS
ncbi:MAG: hypothetical protein HQM10_13255 [Candidatus Riflebacteria bacterium]|nr:hypothetical protein [Candidatus Riflebacteria bacterium]